MKLFKKIISVMLITMMIICFQSNIVLAEEPATPPTDGGGDPSSAGTGFNWKGEIEKQVTSTGAAGVMEPINNISGAIITITRVVCVGVAITMLVVLAIKYMTSAPGDRATIKKHAVVYVVGAVVMFACTGILGIIQNFAASI